MGNPNLNPKQFGLNSDTEVPWTPEESTEVGEGAYDDGSYTKK